MRREREGRVLEDGMLVMRKKFQGYRLATDVMMNCRDVVDRDMDDE